MVGSLVRLKLDALGSSSDYPIIAKIDIFFAGELEAARATNVNLYIAQKIKAQSKKKKIPPNQKHKRVGLLIITNFRLCFVVFEEHDKNDKNNSNKVSSFIRMRVMSLAQESYLCCVLENRFASGEQFLGAL